MVVGIDSAEHEGVALLDDFQFLCAGIDLEGKVAVVVGDDGVAALVSDELPVGHESGAIDGHGGLLEIDVAVDIYGVGIYEILLGMERLVGIDI